MVTKTYSTNFVKPKKTGWSYVTLQRGVRFRLLYGIDGDFFMAFVHVAVVMCGMKHE